MIISGIVQDAELIEKENRIMVRDAQTAITS
jgi:hypothetical protein